VCVLLNGVKTTGPIVLKFRMNILSVPGQHIGLFGFRKSLRVTTQWP